MKSVGVRELRQNASRYLRDVQRGESLQVTDRGRPIALIVPLPGEESPLEALALAGRLRSATLDISSLGPPLPAAEGSRPASQILADMRDDGRA
ncbi:MAG: type II toxin-antitoxin system prevent-host-death family antitoxin [Actinobacteria bacterium]|nr:type II toxin-antitoxin system prevent-host-death family antitoxin [Actinomycetota bacterium]